LSVQGPVDGEVVVGRRDLGPVESHVDGFGPLLPDGVVGETNGRVSTIGSGAAAGGPVRPGWFDGTASRPFMKVAAIYFWRRMP
jgi:hypothetical protein